MRFVWQTKCLRITPWHKLVWGYFFCFNRTRCGKKNMQKTQVSGWTSKNTWRAPSLLNTNLHVPFNNRTTTYECRLIFWWNAFILGDVPPKNRKWLASCIKLQIICKTDSTGTVQMPSYVEFAHFNVLEKPAATHVLNNALSTEFVARMLPYILRSCQANFMQNLTDFHSIGTLVSWPHRSWHTAAATRM